MIHILIDSKRIMNQLPFSLILNLREINEHCLILGYFRYPHWWLRIIITLNTFVLYNRHHSQYSYGKISLVSCYLFCLFWQKQQCMKLGLKTSSAIVLSMLALLLLFHSDRKESKSFLLVPPKNSFLKQKSVPLQIWRISI